MHGDLGDPANRIALERSIDVLLEVASSPPQAVAHDLHREFHSHACRARAGAAARGARHRGAAPSRTHRRRAVSARSFLTRRRSTTTRRALLQPTSLRLSWVACQPWLAWVARVQSWRVNSRSIRRLTLAVLRRRSRQDLPRCSHVDDGLKAETAVPSHQRRAALTQLVQEPPQGGLGMARAVLFAGAELRVRYPSAGCPPCKVCSTWLGRPGLCGL